MKKVTLFAVIGFGLLVLNALFSFVSALNGYVYDYYQEYGYSYRFFRSLTALIGLIMLEIFFVKLYSRQK